MLILDSDYVEPGDRDDALEATFNSSEVPQRVQYVSPPQSIRHRIELFELGPGVHLLRNTGTGIHIVRGPREVRSGAPEQLAICLQGSGTGQLDWDGGQYVKNPGDLSIQDTTCPYSYRQSGRNDHKVVVIDPALLTLPVDLIRRAAHTLPGSPLYPLVRQHFASLCDDSRDLPADASGRLGRATAQLVAALITTAVGDVRRQEALGDSLLLRITMYIDAHLADPGLNAGQIAVAHSVSLRQLYRVWARSDHGVPLGEWILRRRLERARGQLNDCDPAEMTIAAIARSNGFTNASHFTRQFHRAFETTPREWRRVSREPLVPTGPPLRPPIPRRPGGSLRSEDSDSGRLLASHDGRGR
jgi:AraC family transcriptional regulator, positive regulator of tynA and feaB